MALFILLTNTGFLVHRFNTVPCSSTAGMGKQSARMLTSLQWIGLKWIVLIFKKSFNSFLKGKGSEQSLSQWCIEMAGNSVPLRDKYCK